MKSTIFLFFLLAFFVVNSFAETLDEDLVRAEMLKQYATVTGGWYLEKKCDELSREEMREFDWHIFHLGQTMQKITSQERLKSIQHGAQAAVNSENQAECNDENKRLIHSIVDLSRQLNKVLNDKTYVKAESDREYDFQRFISAAAAMKINNACPDFLDDEIKLSVNEAYESVQHSLMSQYGILFSEYVMENDRKFKQDITCSDETKSFLMNGLGKLSALEIDLRK